MVSSISYFADFLGPQNQELAGITGNDLRRFIIALKDKNKYTSTNCSKYHKPREEKLSPLSIETYARAIRAFFGFLARNEFIETDPMAAVKMPKVPQTVVPTFTDKEMEKLLAMPDKHSMEGFRNYALLLTFIDTGARLSELANLKMENINYDECYFRVMGKGQKERNIPFGKKVARILLKYQLKYRPEPVGTDNFWLNRNGRPFAAERMEKAIRRYGQEAGLKRCYPHKLRHTSSVLYLRNGGDPFSLQRKLGHASLQMTRHYSNLADIDVRNQHLKFSPGDRLKG